MRYTRFENLETGEKFTRGHGSSLAFEKIDGRMGRTLLNNTVREFGPSAEVLAHDSRCTVATGEDTTCGRRAHVTWTDELAPEDVFGACRDHAVAAGAVA